MNDRTESKNSSEFSDTIAGEFVNAPGRLYDTPENLSLEARRELFEIEETLVSCLYAQQTAELQAGELPPAQAEARAFLDSENMNDAALASLRVPDVLHLVIERSLVADQPKAAATPAIVLQLRDGLQVIKSAFQGLQLQTESVATTRSAVAAPEARRSHVVLTQTIDGRRLEYEILSESDNAATLVVRFPEGGPSLQKIRIVLRQDGRMLDSRTPDAAGKASFEHLAAGDYELEFSGALKHTCPVLVRD